MLESRQGGAKKIQLMRFILFIFTVLLLSSVAAAQNSSAGVNIPAHQTFVLGEYEKEPYTAKLENKGQVEVLLSILNKDDKSLITSIKLAPKQSEKVEISPDQLVTMENSSDRKAKVFVKMTETVEGMRYIDQSEEIEIVDTEVQENLPQEVEVDSSASAAKEKVISTLAPGRTWILGEGTSAHYSVLLKRSGGGVKVSIRDRKTGVQTQGFGLGPAEDGATVHIRPHEVIYLVNTSILPANVSAEFSQAVSGSRKVSTK